MSEFQLKYLPLFEYDLSKIVDYITNKLYNPDAARRLVGNTMEVRRIIYSKRNIPEHV
jgi:hypothetical protein